MKWLDRLFGKQPQARTHWHTLPTVKTPKGINPNPRTAREYAKNASAKRKRQAALGITSYRWLAARPDGCETAAKHNGKVFRFDRPPSEGHPGECDCDFDFCRYCIANPIVPGFDD